MPASDFIEPQRFSVTLDPALVLERLILRRLSSLNRKRTQDWLRSLVTQGFVAEGQWLRRDGSGRVERSDRTPPIPATAFADWLEHKRISAPPVNSVTTAPRPATNGHIERAVPKPFAQLRNVIG